MSVSSMADMAFARRADTGDPKKGLESVREAAKEKGEKPATASAVTSAIGAAAAFIPTEVLTVYVAILGTLGVVVPTVMTPAASPGSSPLPVAPEPAAGSAQAVTSTPIELYVVFLILTPIVVWALYAAKAVNAGKRRPTRIRAWPKWEMLAGTVAFAIWAAALPSSPLSRYDWFSAGLTGILALIASMLLGVLTPVFASKALANQ